MIGTGYVGLVTGTCFSEMGHNVTCYDIACEKIEKLKCGQIPIYEPGLSELVSKNSSSNRLHFTTDLRDALRAIDVIFLAVPTPSDEDGNCDLNYLFAAAKSIAEELTADVLIVNKSTAPIGTAERLQKHIQENLKCDIAFDVVSNPEFLREGSAVGDCMKPDRVIIGSNNDLSTEVMRQIYRPFTMNRDRIIVMDVKSAEMTKYAANVMLASRISIMNEFARLCEASGADINKVRVGIGSDPRIGYGSIYPGLGFGGSCFPKDLRALRAIGRTYELPTPIMDAVERVNEHQKQTLHEKMQSYFSSLEGKTIAIWGLSYKPDTDDTREAPSIVLIKLLLASGASLRLYDPAAMQRLQTEIAPSEDVVYCNDEYSAATGADAICLVTEWKQFRFIDFKRLAPLLTTKVVFDGRNQYQAEELAQLGFDYIGIGTTSRHSRAFV